MVSFVCTFFLSPPLIIFSPVMTGTISLLFFQAQCGLGLEETLWEKKKKKLYKNLHLDGKLISFYFTHRHVSFAVSERRIVLPHYNEQKPGNSLQHHAGTHSLGSYWSVLHLWPNFYFRIFRNLRGASGYRRLCLITTLPPTQKYSFFHAGKTILWEMEWPQWPQGWITIWT